MKLAIPNRELDGLTDRKLKSIYRDAVKLDFDNKDEFLKPFIKEMNKRGLK